MDIDWRDNIETRTFITDLNLWEYKHTFRGNVGQLNFKSCVSNCVTPGREVTSNKLLDGGHKGSKFIDMPVGRKSITPHWGG